MNIFNQSRNCLGMRLQWINKSPFKRNQMFNWSWTNKPREWWIYDERYTILKGYRSWVSFDPERKDLPADNQNNKELLGQQVSLLLYQSPFLNFPCYHFPWSNKSWYFRHPSISQIINRYHILQKSYYTEAHIHSRNFIGINQLFSMNFHRSNLTILLYYSQRDSL